MYKCTIIIIIIISTVISYLHKVHVYIIITDYPVYALACSLTTTANTIVIQETLKDLDVKMTESEFKFDDQFEVVGLQKLHRSKDGKGGSIPIWLLMVQP